MKVAIFSTYQFHVRHDPIKLDSFLPEGTTEILCGYQMWINPVAENFAKIKNIPYHEYKQKEKMIDESDCIVFFFGKWVNSSHKLMAYATSKGKKMYFYYTFPNGLILPWVKNDNFERHRPR